MTLDAADVLAAAADWVWIPDDARTVDTDEFLLIAYPAHFSEPTVALRYDSARPADGLIDDILRAAEDLGRSSVVFFEVNEATRPADLEPRLRERDAELIETLAVLALDLRDGLPDLDVPADVELRPIQTLADMQAVDRINAAVFGGTKQDDDALAESLERGLAEGRSLALRAGVPLGTAGCVLTDETLRLWGGCVLAEARGTGVYRALLDHRLREGAAAGCRMALVKGRVDTSAPVLLRAGFVQYGEIRAYRLPTG